MWILRINHNMLSFSVVVVVVVVVVNIHLFFVYCGVSKIWSQHFTFLCLLLNGHSSKFFVR